MKVKMILPALADARGPYWRAIKYTRFPPLGLATLAAYFDPGDEVEIQDEHVERLDLDDRPDLVILQVYVTSAYRAYAVADHYRAAGRTCASAGFTRPRSRARRPPTRTPSSWARARTPSRGSCAIGRRPSAAGLPIHHAEPC